MLHQNTTPKALLNQNFTSKKTVLQVVLEQKKPFKVSLTLYAFYLVQLLQNQKCLSLAVIINSLQFHTREADYTSLKLLYKSY